jgi:flagellar biosynthesis GTPase FlhF
MKVSMSNAVEGIEVTVSAQLHHEGSERGALVSRLAAQGAYIEDEGLDTLQEILRTSMPEALLQADSTLRIAIEERLLSFVLDRHSSRNSLSDSVKDKQPVEAVPPATTEIIVVYGPPGCGKTTNAERLRAHFNADDVIDGEGPGIQPARFKRTLILTNDTIRQAMSGLFSGSLNMAWIDSIRFFSFDAIKQELN